MSKLWCTARNLTQTATFSGTALVMRSLILLASGLCAFSLVPPAASQPLPEKRGCGVFFEKWDIPGAPTSFTLMSGVGLELFAANDCISQNRIAVACDHYRRALSAVEKTEPAQAGERRPKIKAAMAQINCQ